MIPIELVQKITRDAMQLRHLELCKEIKQIWKFIKKAEHYFGISKIYTYPEFLKIAHEIIIGGAPEITEFTTAYHFEQTYRNWKQNYPNYQYNINWPRCNT